MINKKLIPVAVATAMCAPLMAQANNTKSNAPIVYGKAHVSFGTLEKKVNGTTTVDNW